MGRANAFNKAAAELLDYLKAYNLTDLSSQAKYKANVRGGYRRFHGLLILHAALSQGVIWKGNPAKEEEFRLYLEECTSDLCQSLFVSFHGLYKPAYLLLRSAVENFFRLVGIYDSQNVLSLTSVYELIAVVKTTTAIQSSPNAKKQFARLTASYAELCKYAHSAGKEYMSFTSVVGNFPKYEEDHYSEYQQLFRTTTVAMCSILWLLFRTRFISLHHTHFDFISDLLPRDVRLELIER